MLEYVSFFVVLCFFIVAVTNTLIRVGIVLMVILEGNRPVKYDFKAASWTLGILGSLLTWLALYNFG
jgi:hypothetical protein